jgi:hypothetical protein
MRTIRSKLTYANVVATLALFIALGGVSYAAVKLPKNSVGEKQIKKNAVTAKKIKKNSVTGAKVKDGSLSNADINLDLAKLGKVPSAAVADTSGDAEEVVVKTGKVTGTASTTVDAIPLATPVPLLHLGQLSFFGKCVKDTSSDIVAAVLYAESSTTGSYFTTSLYTFSGNQMLSGASYTMAQTTATNGILARSQDSDSTIAIGTDGIGVSASSTVSVINDPSQAASIYPATESCLFSLKSKKFKL